MRITDIKTHVLSTPLDVEFAFSMGWVHRRSTMIVELLTDDGVTGWGESLCHGLQPPDIAATIVESALKPLVVGEDPFDVERVVGAHVQPHAAVRPGRARCPTRSAPSTSPSGIAWAARSAKPIHKLLGGAYRTEVQPYATGFYRRAGVTYPDDAIDEARRHMSKGFTAMKLKIGFGVEDDIHYVRSVREAIGPEPLLMVDAEPCLQRGRGAAFVEGVRAGPDPLVRGADLARRHRRLQGAEEPYRHLPSRRRKRVHQDRFSRVDFAPRGGHPAARHLRGRRLYRVPQNRGARAGLAHADHSARVGLGHRAGRLAAVAGHVAADAAGAQADRADAGVRPIGASVPARLDLRRHHDAKVAWCASPTGRAWAWRSIAACSSATRAPDR